jgi:hypothetical protein
MSLATDKMHRGKRMCTGREQIVTGIVYRADAENFCSVEYECKIFAIVISLSRDL